MEQQQIQELLHSLRHLQGELAQALIKMEGNASALHRSLIETATALTEAGEAREEERVELQRQHAKIIQSVAQARGAARNVDETISTVLNGAGLIGDGSMTA